MGTGCSVSARPPARPGDFLLRAGRPSAAGVQGAPAAAVPRARRSVAGLRRVRRRDHRDGRRPTATSSSWPRSGCAAGSIVDAVPAAACAPRGRSARGRPPSTATGKRTSATSADLAEVWPAFRAFVGDDLLVAHNGHTFDVPVLRRIAAGLPGSTSWCSSTPCRWLAR